MTIETRIFHPDGDVVLLLSRRNEETEKREAGGPGAGKSSDDDVIRMQVSSMHLTLVSPVFKAMLSGNFKEGTKLREKGSLEIPLAEDDPITLTILLNIIHGHANRVPLEINISELTSLAKLVNYYQLGEVVKVYATIWVRHVHKEWLSRIPHGGYAKDSFLFLFICWVFAKPVEFNEVTEHIGLRFTGKIGETETRALPTPDLVISAIISQRAKALDKILHRLRELRSEYTGDFAKNESPIICVNRKVECDAMVLGGLVKVLEGRNVDKFSVSSFVSMLRNNKIPRLCGNSRCGVWKTLGATLLEVDMVNWGLHLRDFTSPPMEY